MDAGAIVNAPRKPTADECSTHASIPVYEGLTGIACWYPQMGGYTSECVVVFATEGGPDRCFEAFVWHDGEFPFETGNPREIHHCRARQFVAFGEFVEAAQRKALP